MDFRTIRAVINANADKSLSASARLVIVALAVGIYKAGGQCRTTVKELAKMCNMTPRTIISIIGALKAAGVVRVIGNGTANAYELNGEIISPSEGENISPSDGGNGEIISCKGENISPSGGVYIGLEVKENVCENTRGRECARAHTRARNFDELTESDAIAAGESAGVSADMARQVFADMKANGGGYMNRNGVFVKVTSENLQAAIRAMGKRAQSEPQAAMPKPKEHRAADVATAKALCAERCAMFKAGKCGAGVAVLPYLSEHPHPPEECKHFKPLRK